MPVQSLSKVAAGVAIRKLQEFVCVQVLELQESLPHRYTTIEEETAFHDRIRHITVPTRRILELIGKRNRDLNTAINLEQFVTWMEQLEKFTTLAGIREFGHAVWCQSQTCQIYECKFMTTSDNCSVNVFPNWLEVIRGPYGTISAVYYLEVPTS